MSEMHAIHENAKIKDYSTINPDIELEEAWSIVEEFIKDEANDLLVGLLIKKLKTGYKEIIKNG